MFARVMDSAVAARGAPWGTCTVPTCECGCKQTSSRCRRQSDTRSLPCWVSTRWGWLTSTMCPVLYSMIDLLLVFVRFSCFRHVRRVLQGCRSLLLVRNIWSPVLSRWHSRLQAAFCCQRVSNAARTLMISPGDRVGLFAFIWPVCSSAHRMTLPLDTDERKPLEQSEHRPVMLQSIAYSCAKSC